MKKFFGLIFVLLLVLTGCNNRPFHPSDLVKVGIERSEYFSVDKQIKEIEKGDNASFNVSIKGNYTFVSASYENNELSNITDNSFTITFKKISYPVMISLNFEDVEGDKTITYYSGLSSSNPVKVKKTGVHLKENSINGYLYFSRPGYIPLGWNDQSDYSGNLISFGSRIPNDVKKLYLQWEKETDLSLFQFKEVEGGFEISKYLGNDEKVVVPMTYNNHPVVGLGKNSFTGESVKTLVLSKNITYIENRAFSSSQVENLYMCDNVNQTYINSFYPNMIKNIHINAVRRPTFSGTYYDTFPDKVDYLETIKDTPKVILFSGSSTRFGYYSPAMEEILTDYKVINMGVYAYVNIKPQLDVITNFTIDNDIILSSPEFDNHCLIEQFGEDNNFEWEMLAMIESNYDLLRYIDMSKYERFFESFYIFQSFRNNMEEKDYSVSPKHYDDEENYYEQETYNIQGDIIIDRPGHPRDEWIMQPIDEYKLSTTITVERINSLNKVYQSIIDKNLRVFFTFFPKNRNCISSSTTRLDIEEIENYLRENLLAPVISKWEDSILPGTCFYLIDNHLCSSAALERSIRVANELKVVL